MKGQEVRFEDTFLLMRGGAKKDQRGMRKRG
jgi:hypothetical protein